MNDVLIPNKEHIVRCDEELKSELTLLIDNAIDDLDLFSGTPADLLQFTRELRAYLADFRVSRVDDPDLTIDLTGVQLLLTRGPQLGWWERYMQGRERAWCSSLMVTVIAASPLSTSAVTVTVGRPLA